MKLETKIRIYRCVIILLLLLYIIFIAYEESHPYTEEGTSFMDEEPTIQRQPNDPNIRIEGETVYFGGNSTAPQYIWEDDFDLFYGFSEEEVDLMAACVFFEAGNQSMEGKRLVVDVILNRMTSSRFPETVSGVLSAPGQFVTWKKIKKVDPNDIPFSCYGAVIAEISAECRYDEFLGFNVYFFSSDNWNSRVHLAKVGDHYFGGL